MLNANESNLKELAESCAIAVYHWIIEINIPTCTYINLYLYALRRLWAVLG